MTDSRISLRRNEMERGRQTRPPLIMQRGTSRRWRTLNLQVSLLGMKLDVVVVVVRKTDSELRKILFRNNNKKLIASAECRKKTTPVQCLV